MARLGLWLFAAVLLIACCQPARAAVVEADDVQRQVDTPTGVRTQTGIQEPQAVAPAAEATSSHPGSQGAGGGGASGPQSGAGGGSSGVDTPLPAAAAGETPAATSPSRGGGGLLGPLLVGLLVVVVGVFLVARSRGESA